MHPPALSQSIPPIATPTSVAPPCAQLCLGMGAARSKGMPPVAAESAWPLARSRLVLDLPACGATVEQVSAAFRRAARRHHPDKRKLLKEQRARDDGAYGRLSGVTSTFCS